MELRLLPKAHTNDKALLQILRLQTKLSKLHNTDGVADKRALQTLQQHVQMLQEECKVPS